MPVVRAASKLLAEDYSSTAHEYDQLWGPVILPMGLPILDALPLEQARRIADLGTGVGALFPYLRSEAPYAQICGVDYSEGMLRRAKARGQSSVAVMDAQQLALRSQAFDVALLIFVLFHIPDALQALAEVHRILRGSGRVGLTTWSYDPGLPGAEMWTDELDRSGAAPDPRHPSVRRHGLVDRPEKVSGLLEAAGFHSIRIWTGEFERQWDHESLLMLQQSCGVAGRRLASLAPEAGEDCVARVRDRLQTIPLDELVWRPAVLYAIAEVRE